MSTETERRVIEMRLDSNQLKKEAQTTLTTLEKLKIALNFTSTDKGFNELNSAAKALSDDGLSNISKSIENLEKRFSAFGIISMRLLENLTDSAYRFATKGLAYIGNAIKQGGINRAFNIENAHFSLQALLKDEEQVQAIMADANASVTDTAYAYDEAAQAAAQFAATGYRAGQQMQNALRGIVGVAAMTNSEYSSISRIFTTIAGNGRLMGDQLLQLSSRGLNAAATIADYLREVQGQTTITEAAVREMVTKGQVSFNMFAEAMNWAFGDAAYRANETFNGAMSNLKSAFSRIGAGFISPLIEQNSSLINLLNTIRTKVNEVKTALVFDESYGNVHAISKQFTDMVLRMSDAASDFVANMDLSQVFTTLYYGAESLKNVFSGLYSVIKPIGQAFKSVFLSFSVTDVKMLARQIMLFTQNLKVSEKTSRNIKDTFTGLFNILKLLGSSFVYLVKVILPVTDSAGGLLDVFFALTGLLGRALTAIVTFINQTKLIKAVFTGIGAGVRAIGIVIVSVVELIYELLVALYEIPVVQNTLRSFAYGVIYIGSSIGEAMDFVVKKIKSFSNGMSELSEKFRGSKISLIGAGLYGIYENLKAFGKYLGLDKALKSIKNFILGIGSALSTGDVLNRLNSFRDKFMEFVLWIKNTVGPAFEGFSLNNIISAGISLTMVSGLFKLGKAITNFSNPLNSLSGALNAFSESIKADVMVKNAKAILILAGALAILSLVDTEKLFMASIAIGALAAALLYAINKFNTILSPARAMSKVATTLAKSVNNFTKALKWKAIATAIKALSISFVLIIGSVLLMAYAIKKDEQSVYKGLAVIAGIVTAITGIAIIMSSFFKGGTGVLAATAAAKLGATMLAMTASLYIVILSLKKLFDLELPSTLNEWIAKMGTLAILFALLSGLVIAIGFAGKVSGGKNIGKNYKNIVALSIFLTSTVKSLKTLFDLEIKEDWPIRLLLLVSVFVSLSAVILVMGKATNLANGKLKGSAIILSMILYLWTVVGALSVISLIPLNRLQRSTIALGSLLLILAGVLAAAGSAANSLKGSASSIMAISVTIGVIAASLSILSIIDWKSLIPAAVALGGCLLALSQVFKQMGSMRYNTKPIRTIISMMVALAGVVASLIILARLPYNNLLAAGAALGTVLLSFSKMMKTISSSSGLSSAKIKSFLTATLSLIPIAAALALIAFQPWDSILAAGASLSMVVLSFGNVIRQISKSSGIRIDKVKSFFVATLSVVPIAAALALIAFQPWDSILAAGASLVMVLTSVTAAYKIISKSNINAASSGAFLLFCLSTIEISLALLPLTYQPWESILAAAGAISAVLIVMSGILAILAPMGPTISAGAIPAALALVEFLGIISGAWMLMVGIASIVASIPGASGALNKGIDLLSDLFSGLGKVVGSIISGLGEGLTSKLPAIGENLGLFALNSKPFFDIIGSLGGETASAIYLVTNAISSFASIGWGKIISDLNPFGASTGSVKTQGAIVIFSMQLAESASYIKKYSDEVSKVNYQAVSMSMTMWTLWAKLSKSVFSNIDFPASSAISIVMLGEAIGQYYAGIESIDPVKMDEVNESILKFMDTISKLKDLKISGSDFRTFIELFHYLAESANQEFQNVFIQESANAENVVEDYLNGIVAKIQNAEVIFEESGRNTANACVDAIFETFNLRRGEIEDEMNSVGIFTVGGFEAGLSDQNALSKIAEVAAATANLVIDTMKETLDIHSPSRRAYAIAEATNMGFANGLSDSSGLVLGAAALLGYDVVNEYASIPDRVATAILSNSGSVYTALQTIRRGAVGLFTGEDYDAITSAAQEKLLDNVTEGLTDAHAGRQLTREEQMNGVRNYAYDLAYDMASAAEAATQEVLGTPSSTLLDYEQEVYGYNMESMLEDLEYDIADYSDLMSDYVGATSSASSAKADIFEDDIDTEQSYWSDLLRIRRQGIEAEKYQEMTLVDFKKEVQEQSAELLESYMNQLQSASDTLMKEYNLFKEVEEQEEVSKDTLIKNLEDQISAHQEYNEVLESLNDRLKNQNLGEYLRTLGTDSLAELKAINSMTDEELSNYAGLYDQKMSEARNGAILQLQDLQESTEAAIAEVLGGMASSINLFDFAGMFDGTFESLNRFVEEIMLPLDNATAQAEIIFQEFGQNFTDAFAAGLDPEKFKEMIRNNILADQNIGKEEGSEIGQNITSGVGEGMISNQSAISSSSNEVIDSIEDEMRKAADIHSPSVRFEDNIGHYITEGVAVGMTDDMESIILASEEIINTIEESVDERTEGLLATIIVLLTSIVKVIEEEQYLFKEIGEKTVESYKEGMEEQHEILENEGTTFAQLVLSGIMASLNEFYEMGQNAGNGFVEGLKSTLSEISKVSVAIGTTTIGSTKKSLDEHSPSKKMGLVGYNAGLGYLNNLALFISKVAQCGEELGDATTESVQNSIDETNKGIAEMLKNYSISIAEFDTSDAIVTSRDISKMFNDSIAFARINAQNIRSLSEHSDVLESGENDSSNINGKTEINMVQNNYSPKALSRIEIYRDYKNLVSRFREAVNNA